MKLWRGSRLILALLLLAVVAVVIGLAGGWQRLVIEPAASILWLVWRVLLSLPQTVYWALVILLAAWPLFRLAAVRRRKDYRPAYRAEALPASRVDFWRAAIQDASLSRKQRRRFETALHELKAEALPSARESEMSSVATTKALTGSDRGVKTAPVNGAKGQGRVRIGGFVLPIETPPGLRPVMRQLFRPDYKDIDTFLHSMEMEMEIADDIDPNGSVEQ